MSQHFVCLNRDCPGVVRAAKGSRQACPTCGSRMRAVTWRRMEEHHWRNHVNTGIAPSIVPDVVDR